MFKVHYDNLEDVIEMSGISKHFMFKVHLNQNTLAEPENKFQNISCLRFISTESVLVRTNENFKTFHV